MKLLDWIKKNADKLKDIPNAQEVLKQLSTLSESLGNTFLVDDAKTPNYIPKNRLDEVITQKNMQKDQINDLTKQIEVLKTSTGDSEKLQQQITKLQETLGSSTGENEELKKQVANLSKTAEQVNSMQTTIQELQNSNEGWNTKYTEALVKSRAQMAAVKAEAKNPESLLKLLDLSKVKIDGDNLLGLDDQIKALKETDSYLFDEPPIGLPPSGKGNFQRPILDPGQDPKKYTEEILRNMTPEEINQNWAEISKQMQSGQLANE